MELTTTTKKLTFGNCPVDVDKYQEIKEELLKFGLTSNQVKVFFYLGKFGSKTAIRNSSSVREIISVILLFT